MTSTTTSDDVSLANEFKGVQLKNLPSLKVVPKATLDDPLKKILEKAIAIQLKTINTEVSVSQLAFENLILLVDETLSDMLMSLHKIANIQRRHQISKKDLLLIIEGYNLSFADLLVESHRSQYAKSHSVDIAQKINESGELVLRKERTPLSQEELLRTPNPEFFVKDTDILTLVPPSVKKIKHVPKWLPDFPPDHTYRFTSLYNTPITDERQMKRKLAEESSLSEKALINLSKLGTEESATHVDNNTELFKESQQDNDLIFEPAKKKRSAVINEMNDLLRTLPQQNYNVEEYARSRLDLARRKVSDYERRQLQLQRGPFIRATHLLSPFSKQRLNCKVAEKEVKSLLHRSYIGLLTTVPLLKEQRKQHTALAEQNRREREEQLRIQRDEGNKPSKELEELDFSNFNEDPFFGGLESSDSEPENGTIAPALSEDPAISDSPSKREVKLQEEPTDLATAGENPASIGSLESEKQDENPSTEADAGTKDKLEHNSEDPRVGGEDQPGPESHLSKAAEVPQNNLENSPDGYLEGPQDLLGSTALRDEQGEDRSDLPKSSELTAQNEED
ncbi:LADA_0H05314g1_1 [Lachancea dasiensis]|uniref:Transcription initiation factor TFIID subunit 8 n=1 Tax=Lachancea dasiensis TaxID=1072105 RepID=A0A1G4K148_9SACH|nr:LADA_0H05314g1_1 [Lachancea dasiensis]